MIGKKHAVWILALGLAGCAGGMKLHEDPYSSKRAYLNSPRGMYELCLSGSYVELYQRGIAHEEAFAGAVANCQKFRAELLQVFGHFEFTVKYLEDDLSERLKKASS